jgi:serine/threonine-protein kinase
MMETTMETDDLKRVWQLLDQRLQQQHALTLRLHTERRLDQARARLRPLHRGQLVQIAAGGALAVLAGSFWPGVVSVPHLLAAALLLQAYGVLLLAFGAHTLWRLQRIDYAAPVLAIQQQLAELHRAQVRINVCAGLSWWLLWVPFVMVLCAGLSGVDLYANAPQWVLACAAVGGAGLLASWGLYRRSRDPRRPRLAKFVDDSLIGRSLRRAQVEVDEIARFEHE